MAQRAYSKSTNHWDTSETVSRIAEASVRDLSKDGDFTMKGWYKEHTQNPSISVQH